MAQRFESLRKLTGTTQSSGGSDPIRRRSRLADRRYFGPVLTLTMGLLLYVYSRTTIAAAKDNAARSREADGGSINWRNENARRHGILKKPEEPSSLQYFLTPKPEGRGKSLTPDEQRQQGIQTQYTNPIEDRIRQAKTRRPSNNDD
ncbi:MAG: hypothetical protein M1828_002854 [Chrysothrix sp. TS-e1954]|nr:MAG: hypothetical protein M1828_002854 [Chrysothrix sp. TS-e1954]